MRGGGGMKECGASEIRIQEKMRKKKGMQFLNKIWGGGGAIDKIKNGGFAILLFF